MHRIIIHHTAGSYTPNNVDKKAYHYLVHGDGFVSDGLYKPEDNENCKDNVYAAHTFQGNTGSIGVAACCNFNFRLDSPHTSTRFPLTDNQLETLCKLCAVLCNKYKISINNIFTHYGFDKAHNIKQGKVDITYLPQYPDLTPEQVQEYFRRKIKVYLNNSKQ